MTAFRWFKPETDPKFFTLQPRAQVMLDQARSAAGIPFFVTSGRRTKEENASAGGSPNSLHLEGLAFDLRINNANEIYHTIRGLLTAGFNQIIIGVRKDGTYHHLHVELDDKNPAPHISVKFYS